MKVGILTYHRVINKGSVMQAYSLQRVLEEHLPDADIELIDYRVPSVEFRKFRKILKKRPPFFDTAQYGKTKSVRTFLNERCNVSESSCLSSSTERARDFIHSQNYDAVVVGSDTVWSVRRGGGAPLAPNIYTLPDVSGVTKVGFAVSGDQTTPTLLNDDERRTALASAISDFDYISVRDGPTRDRLTDIGISAERINLMPDPTVLWDFSPIVEIPSVDLERPIAGIEIPDSPLKRSVVNYLQSNGYDTISFLGKAGNTDRPLRGGFSVPERIGMYSQVDILVTDRFHGSLFSLQTSETPVIFIESSDKYPLPNSKGRDLYATLDAEELVWRPDEGHTVSESIESRLDEWESIRDKLFQNLLAIRERGNREVDHLVNTIETNID